MEATDTTTTTAACAKCRYWQEQDTKNGECRRRAPQAVVLDIDEGTRFESHFPVTAGNDWCGEFAAR